MDLIDVKVLHPHAIILSASASKLQATLVPLDVIQFGGPFETPATSLGKRQKLPEFQNVVVPFIDFYDVCVSDNMNFGTYVPSVSLSLIAFPTLSRMEMRQTKKEKRKKRAPEHEGSIPGERKPQKVENRDLMVEEDQPAYPDTQGKTCRKDEGVAEDIGATSKKKRKRDKASRT